MRKFKTAAGYLRSKEKQLYYKQGRAESRNETAISDDDGARQIINGLLPQIGVTESIALSEHPAEAVQRMLHHARGTTRAGVLDPRLIGLEACEKWLKRQPRRAHLCGQPMLPDLRARRWCSDRFQATSVDCPCPRCASPLRPSDVEVIASDSGDDDGTVMLWRCHSCHVDVLRVELAAELA